MTATTSHQTDGETHNTQTARLASTNSGTQEIQAIHDKVGVGMSGSVKGTMPSPTELIETSEGDKHLVIGLQYNLTKG